jgi:hypothetical protein
MLIDSPLVGTGSGSLGGITMSHNRGGQYLRRRVIPTNPGTSLQQANRAGLALLATNWSTVLTSAQRAAWDLYASNVAVINALGATIYLTGQQQYIRSNTPRIQAALSVIDDAPTTFNLGEVTQPILSLVDVTVPEVQITFTDGDAWTSEDGAYLLVYMGKPQGPGITFFKGPYRFMDSVAGDITIPPTNPASMTSPFIYTAGQLAWAQCRVTRADGRLSLPLRIGPTVATT